MYTFTDRDFQLNQEYHQRKFTSSLKDVTHTTQEDNLSSKRIPINMHKGRMLILTIVVLFSLILTAPIHAQMINDADVSLGTDLELALIMGTYYYNHAQYEMAIEQFQSAIDAMPDRYFEFAPEQVIVFWQLAEALKANGQLSDALNTYLHFLDIAGVNATDYSIAYVAKLGLLLDPENA